MKEHENDVFFKFKLPHAISIIEAGIRVYLRSYFIYSYVRSYELKDDTK